MSKSLKNFITIQDALKQYTANQIRLVFLIHSWDSLLDYKDESLKRAIGLEQTFQKFFLGCRSLIQEQLAHPIPFSGEHNFHDAEKELLANLLETQTAVHAALCDSFDTPTVMNQLSSLVSQANVYMSNKARDVLGTAKVNVMLLERVGQWITKMLGVFGVSVEQTGLRIGFSTFSATSSSLNREAMLLPYLSVLGKFRDQVRSMAKSKEPHQAFLQLTDKVRDEDLVQLDVLLDDREDGTALVKFVDKAVILKEREEKRTRELEKMQKKLEAQQMQEAKRLEKLNKGKTPPEELFKDMEALKLYSKWDEAGVPTHDVNGEELAKNRRKKLQTARDAQVKLHQEWKDHSSK